MYVYVHICGCSRRTEVLQEKAIVSCVVQEFRPVLFKSSMGSWLPPHLSSPINYFLSSTEHHFYQLFFFLKLSCSVGKGMTMGVSHSKTLLSIWGRQYSQRLHRQNRMTHKLMCFFLSLKISRANTTISVDNSHRNFKRNFNLWE